MFIKKGHFEKESVPSPPVEGINSMGFQGINNTKEHFNIKKPISISNIGGTFFSGKVQA